MLMVMLDVGNLIICFDVSADLYFSPLLICVDIKIIQLSMEREGSSECKPLLKEAILQSISLSIL